jgi:hypothetical protein
MRGGETMEKAREEVKETPITDAPPAAPKENVLMTFKDFDTKVELIETADMIFLEAEYTGGPLNSVGIPKQVLPQVVRSLLFVLNGGKK